jgi:hypothetical protein
MTYLSLGEAGREYPSESGRGVSPHTVTRHAVKGVKARSSSGRIKLRTVWNGSRLLTTSEWVSEFIEALTQDRTGSTSAPMATARARRADALLEASGW